MFRYPTGAEAADSFAWLGGLARNPGKWDNAAGGLHVYTVQGYFQSAALGEPVAQAASVEDEEAILANATPETIAQAFEAEAAKCRGEAVANANGALVKLLVGKLVQKAIESGLVQQAIQKLFESLLKPTPAS